MLELLEPRLSVTPGTVEKIEILREAGAILEERAADHEGTFAVMRRALLARPIARRCRRGSRQTRGAERFLATIGERLP